MKKISLIFSLAILLFYSCAKEEDTHLASGFGFKTPEEAKAALGNYAKVLAIVDGSIYTRTRQYYNGTQDVTTGGIDAWFNDDSKSRSDAGTFTMNNFEFNFDKNTNGYSLKNYKFHEANNIEERERLDKEVAQIYGGEINAKLVKGNQNIFNIKYYCPPLINATTNLGFEPRSVFRVVTESGIPLKWNKDDKNTNDVIIHIVWTGDRASLSLDQQGSGGIKERVVRVKDSGEYHLKRDFLNFLPTDAIFSLYVIRGNVDVIKGTDSKEYKIYNQSETQLTCVLK